jgi:acetyl-CoA C-acetyltransferase
MRRTDCSQVTDGGVGLVIAGRRKAQEWATKRGLSLDDVPRIAGWGHRTVGLPLANKLQRSANDEFVMPHVRGAITDAFGRAGIADVSGIDGIETHDCFTSSEYMAIDHFGITAPGESWKAIEEGVIERDGATPVNPSGGLIGGGHPVGATGVRMVLDASRQVTGRAGDMQVDGAKTFSTLNIGGSTTTTVSFVVAA